MWKWLRDRRFTNYKFRRQQPVGPYILDFFCAEAKVCIELDGGQHGNPRQKLYDQNRARFLSASGIKELRFWNHKLRRDSEAIRTMIFNVLQERAPHPLPNYARPINQPPEKNNQAANNVSLSP
jgi:very-short-patch-repair endonuclease